LFDLPAQIVLPDQQFRAYFRGGIAVALFSRRTFRLRWPVRQIMRRQSAVGEEINHVYEAEPATANDYMFWCQVAMRELEGVKLHHCIDQILAQF
jgi:hypothetical protein